MRRRTTNPSSEVVQVLFRLELGRLRIFNCMAVIMRDLHLSLL